MATDLSELKQELSDLLEEEQQLTEDYLDMLSATSTSTSAEKEAQFARIQTVYSHRVNLYNLISTTLDIHKNTTTVANNTYTNTAEVSAELQALLDMNDSIITKFKADKITNQQKVAVTNNYGKQYKDYKDLFIALIIILSCLIVVSLLSYTPLLFLTRPLSTAIYIIGGTYVVYLLIHMLMKSDMNNDEYNWMLSPNNNTNTSAIMPSLTGTLGLSPNIKAKGITSCAGEYCCDGTTTVWDDDAGQCVIPVTNK